MRKCEICLREFGEENTFCPFDGHRLTIFAQGDPFIGAVIDYKYGINYKIAEGGMGDVYHATHRQLDLPVAVKILHTDMVADNVAIERFRREAQAAMQIRHTNAIAVMDFGVTENNTVYLVMEYLEGCTLRYRLQTMGRLSLNETNRIMQQVCAAVTVAHKRKIIHRDLKPDNIFLQEDIESGELVVKVLDFGIAKLKYQLDEKALTRQGMVVGTPHYMSPEQCYGKEVDVRSDIYSLGVITYELLTGIPPFDDNSPFGLALKQASEIPKPMYDIYADIPTSVNAVVMHALEKRPNNRPQSVKEFAKELETVLDERAQNYHVKRSVIKAEQIDAELLSDIEISANTGLTPALMLPPENKFDAQAFNKHFANPSISPPALPTGQRPILSKEENSDQRRTNISPSEMGSYRSLIAPMSNEPAAMPVSGEKVTPANKRSIWLPTRKSTTFAVICEICHQEVGRSLVRDSTIICPTCRTNLRKVNNIK